jgi:hypothetical protein
MEAATMEFITLKSLAKELGLTNSGRIKLLAEKGLVPDPVFVLGRLVYSLEDADVVRRVFAERKPYQRDKLSS